MENSTQFGSVITPCFNEQDNIAAFYAALTGVPGISDVIGEIIFVDDGSTDNTYEVVRSLAEKDHRVKCLRFSRNFGSHAALSAGLRRASGAFAVILSADLQDPPEVQLGQAVTCGQPINHVGNTGNSINEHLHLEVRVGPSGVRFDSMAHYDASASPQEQAAYCTWRISGLFQMMDPQRLFASQN